MVSQSVYKIDYTMVLLAVLLAAVMLLLPEFSWAQDGAQIGADADELGDEEGSLVYTICSALNTLRGPVARGLAAIGIVFLGFSLFLGKISWGLALALAIGIGAVFGAPDIVRVLGDGEQACES